MLIGLAMQSVLAWTLGPEKRGEYAVCLIFSTFSAVVFTFGLDWATSYYIAATEKLFNQIITAVFIYSFLITIVMWPILYYVIHIPITFFNQASIYSFYLSIIWASSLILLYISTNILRGLRDFSRLATITLIRFLYVLFITLLLTSTTNLNVFAPILADISGNFFFFITIFIIIRRRWQPQLPSMGTLSNIFGYGSRMILGSVSMLANLRIATIILAFFVSKDEIGYFALAMAILTQLGSLADALNNILLPRIASSIDGRADLVSQMARFNSTVTLVIGAIILFTAKWLIPLIFSDMFIPSISLVIILFPGMWLRSTVKILFAFFNGINRPQFVSLTTFLNIFLNIILLIYSIPRWGIVGAAWVATIANIISSIFAIIMYNIKSNTALINVLIVNYMDITSLFKFFSGKYSSISEK